MTTERECVWFLLLLVFVVGITMFPPGRVAASQALFPSKKDSKAIHFAAARKRPLDADLIKGDWTLGELIEKSGISREEFARTIGIPPSIPNSGRLRDIARSLNKSVEEFRELVRKKTPVPKMPGFHPEQVRAYWTLRELVLLSGISKETFAEEVGFPLSTPDNMKLIDIVRPLNKNVEAFRDVARGKMKE